MRLPDVLTRGCAELRAAFQEFRVPLRRQSRSGIGIHDRPAPIAHQTANINLGVVNPLTLHGLHGIAGQRLHRAYICHVVLVTSRLPSC